MKNFLAILFFCSIQFVFASADSLNIWKTRAVSLLRSRPAEAQQYAKRILQFGLNSKNLQAELDSREILAEAALRLFQPDQAYKQLFEALQLSEKGGKFRKQKIKILLLFGRLNWFLEDFSKASYYFGEAVRTAREGSEIKSALLSEAYLSFSRMYRSSKASLQDFLRVKEFYDYASVMPIDTAYYIQAINLLGSATQLYHFDLDLAGRYYQEAIRLSRNSGDKFLESSYRQNLAEIWMAEGKIPSATDELLLSVSLARQLGSDALVFSGMKLLASCAAFQMDYRVAYDYQKSYDEIRSKYLNESQQRRNDEILREFNVRKKESQARDFIKASVTEKVRVERTKRIFQLSILASLFALFLLVGFFLFYRWQMDRIRQHRVALDSKNSELEKLNQKLQSEAKLVENSRKVALAALKERTEFLSVITHELRNPLHAVIASAQLLEESEGLRSADIKNMEILKFSAENLLGLINNVLDFNRIEAGKVQLNLQVMSVRELLEGIYLTFLHQAREKGLELDFRIDKDLPAAFNADRLRLSQIMVNLLSNAIRFTHEGFVRLELRYEPENSEGNLHFRVSDSGIGMSKTEINRISGFFDQAHAGIQGHYGGSGLGLTIAGRLLALMGGRLIIHSEKGKGSQFSFLLQLKVANPSELLSAGTDPASRDFSGIRILFVEDVAFNRILARRFFEKWKLVCDFAENGEEALILAGRHRYDLIMSDIRLPDVSGVSLLKEIRILPDFINTPILAMTALDGNDMKDELKLSGFQDVLEKPYAPEKLLQLLIRWLGKKTRIEPKSN